MLTLPVAHWVGVVAMFSCGGGEWVRCSRIPHFVVVYLNLIRDMSTCLNGHVCIGSYVRTVLICFSFEP